MSTLEITIKAREFLRQRVAHLPISSELRSMVAERFEPRISRWYADDVFPVRNRRKYSGDVGYRKDVYDASTDEVELWLVRALALTDGVSQFGISRGGEVFTAESYGWSKDQRLYVGGLSPLLDEAAGLYDSLREYGGGRFYEHAGAFYGAKDKRVFMRALT